MNAPGEIPNPQTTKERAANIVHREAAAMLAKIQEKNREILAHAEGCHAEAAEVAAEVKKKSENQLWRNPQKKT